MYSYKVTPYSNSKYAELFEERGDKSVWVARLPIELARQVSAFSEPIDTEFAYGDDVPVDTPVWVRQVWDEHHYSKWEKRYFACWGDAPYTIKVWYMGATSWSAKDRAVCNEWSFTDPTGIEDCSDAEDVDDILDR